MSNMKNLQQKLDDGDDLTAEELRIIVDNPTPLDQLEIELVNRLAMLTVAIAALAFLVIAFFYL